MPDNYYSSYITIGDDWSRSFLERSGTTNYPNTNTPDPSTGTLTDWTGYTAKMQLRDPTLIDAGNPTVDESLVIELSTANGRITIGGTGNDALIVALDHNTTKNLPALLCDYDLVVTSPGGTERTLVYGNLDIRKRVTI